MSKQSKILGFLIFAFAVMNFINVASADETSVAGPILKIEVNKYHNAVFVYPSTSIQAPDGFANNDGTGQRFAFSLDDKQLLATILMAKANGSNVKLFGNGQELWDTAHNLQLWAETLINIVIE